MEDKDPRLTGERIGGRRDEYIAGREGARETWAPGTAAPKPGDYPTSGTDSVEPDRTSEIRRDIERTREDMSETVDAIQDRLRPRNIAANAVDSVRNRASETARDIADTEPVQYVRANPIPTAMVGVGIAGLAWLAFGGREARYSGSRMRPRGVDWRRSNAGYYEVDDYRQTGRTETVAFDHESAERYSPGMSYTEDLRSGWQSGTDRASHLASDVSRRARQTTERTRSSLQRTWNANPLLLGAAAAVAGALVGLAVPETEREHQLMGETRDNMVEGVQQTVRDKVEQVQQAATKAVSQVQNAVGITGGDQPAAKAEGQPGQAGARKPGTPDLGRS
jgi:hypothetical protein